jgi:hypothetical protein
MMSAKGCPCRSRQANWAAKAASLSLSHLKPAGTYHGSLERCLGDGRDVEIQGLCRVERFRIEYPILRTVGILKKVTLNPDICEFGQAPDQS